MRSALAAGLVLFGLLAWFDATSAEAVRFRIRSYSLGRATQTFRSDGDAAARRIYTQGLDLRAYDMLGNHTNSVNAVVDARYTNDFNLPSDRGDDPLFANRSNDLALRLAYLEARPLEAVEFRVGRQWSWGALGVRDFDGVRLSLSPRLDSRTRARVGLYAGRDVQLYNGRINTDEFDVQGLPASNADDVEPRSPAGNSLEWIAGGKLGLDWGDQGAFQFSYRRRWRTFVGGERNPESPRIGSERIGVATAFSPADRVTVSSSAAYHTLLEAIDQAELDLAWNIPSLFGTISAGVEHRRPWFDSSSIFNVFGARPHQGAHASYLHGVDAIATEFEVRGWGRMYHESIAPTGGLALDGPETTRLGGALAHDTDLEPWNHPVDWSSQVSLEADTRGAESTHYLADTRLRTPLFFEDFFVSARALLLGVDAHAPEIESGLAVTYLLGVDIPIRELGTFSLLAERTSGTFNPTTTNLYGTLELTFWP